MRNSFLIIEEGVCDILEYDPKGNFASHSGNFDPYCQYVAFRYLTGNRKTDWCNVIILLVAMLRFVGFKFIRQVRLIRKPYNPGNIVEGESQPIFAWKYMPLRKEK